MWATLQRPPLLKREESDFGGKGRRIEEEDKRGG